MSTLRVSNIEAKADASSPTIDEKVKITSSDGRVLVQVDGKTAGITSIGINTTSTSFTIDGNQNVQFVGVITAANVNTTGVSTFTSLSVTGQSTLTNVNVSGVSTSSRLNVGTGGTVITTTGIGSVGIGTINPQYKFHLGGSSPHAFIEGNWNSTAVSDHSRIYFNDYNFGIGCGKFGPTNDDDLYLWAYNGTGRDIRFCSTVNGTTAVDSGSWTTNMIIKNDGKTGIGTTNPQAKLHIHGGDAYLSFDRGLYFARENANTDWSNYIKATNNPDAGYSSTTENNYWVEIASKGGTHIVLNNDGTRDAARNIHDHFTIWQKDSDSTNGARVFAVDNYGNVQFGNAGVRLDRAWDNNPCITVQRDNTWGTSNVSSEFRIHGIGWTHAEWVGGGSGSDFSVNLRVD